MIELRPFNRTNILTHFEWNNDEELNYYDSDYPHQMETFESFSHRIQFLDSPENSSTRIFEIHSVADQKLIGVVSILGIDEQNKRCFVESVIGKKEYRNRGYGKKALQHSLQYCFDELGMNKVSTFSFDFNDKWLAIVQDAGFVQEGCLRQHALKNGDYCDKLLFSILKEEYEKNHSHREMEMAH